MSQREQPSRLASGKQSPAREKTAPAVTRQETSLPSQLKPAAAALSKTQALFADLSDQELLSIGAPQELLAQVKSIRSEAELDALQTYLPVEAYEGLFLIAATTVKVFAYDTSQLDRVYRILSFIVLGILLLAISFAYQRDWLKLSSKTRGESATV